MTVHVINLDRDTERLARFISVNAHVPETVRIRAVDGRMADRNSLRTLRIISDDVTYNDGELGCALSHIKLWRRALKDQSVVTIVEDDAILARNFRSAQESILKELPADWGIVLWGWNFNSLVWTEIPEGVAPALLKFDQDALCENIEVFRNSHVEPSAFRLLHAFGTVGYSVSPSGAKELLDTCLPLSSMRIVLDADGHSIPNNGIDCAMNRVYPLMKSYVCIPPLVASENRAETSSTRVALTEPVRR